MKNGIRHFEYAGVEYRKWVLQQQQNTQNSENEKYNKLVAEQNTQISEDAKPLNWDLALQTISKEDEELKK